MSPEVLDRTILEPFAAPVSSGPEDTAGLIDDLTHTQAERFRTLVPQAGMIGSGGNHLVFRRNKRPHSPVIKARRGLGTREEIKHENFLYQRRMQKVQDIFCRPEFLGPQEARKVLVRTMARELRNEPVLIQSFVPQIRGVHHEIRGWYSELASDPGLDKENLRPIPISSKEAVRYQQLNEILLLGRQEERFDPQEFLDMQRSDDLLMLMAACDQDDDLRTYIASLVIAMLVTMEETGELFDTAGKGNMLILTETGISARFLDPLFADMHVTSRALRGLEKLHNKEDLESDDLIALLNYANSLRTIRGLALCLDIPPPSPLLPYGWEDDDRTVDFTPLLSESRARIPR
jgi:hypothetical protein